MAAMKQRLLQSFVTKSQPRIPFSRFASRLKSSASASASALSLNTQRVSTPVITMTTSNSNINQQNSSTPSKPSSSFYRRILPESCIAFASQKGKEVFSSAMANNGLKSFFALIQQYTTQSEPAYCGLSTLVVVLNALSVDPQQSWKGPWRWYEERMLNCCLDMEDVKNKGITLRDFRCLAHCQGLSVELTYCDENSTLEDFRAAVQRACVSSEQESVPGTDVAETEEPLDILVVSYSRKVLSQTGSGHFSPIAAYDAESDSVLILDTARFKYGAHWTKLSLVYEAMKPIDPDTGNSRGYALLSFPTQTQLQEEREVVSEKRVVQPVSILFRSKLTQNPARRKYKQFLESTPGELTWERFHSYWSTGKTKLDSVWSMLEPMRMAPHSSEEHVGNLRSLLKEMLDIVHPGHLRCCDIGTEKNKCMRDEEALYVVYLGSLPEESRTDLVMNFESNASRLTREQLLNEAQLVATAIGFSDESTF